MRTFLKKQDQTHEVFDRCKSDYLLNLLNEIKGGLIGGAIVTGQFQNGGL